MVKGKTRLPRVIHGVRQKGHSPTIQALSLLSLEDEVFLLIHRSIASRKLIHPLRENPRICFQEPFKLKKWFIVKHNMIYLRHIYSTFAQTIPCRHQRKSVIVFLTEQTALPTQRLRLQYHRPFISTAALS